VYCPRQCALIHVEGLWDDNRHTVRGEHGHRRVDSGADRTERGHVVLRAVPLWSERLGLTGRADAIEMHPDGSVVPVEYKIGGRHGDAASVQLCAQAMCLEEMLARDVPVGFVWYSKTRRRDRIPFDTALRQRTEAVILEVRKNLEAQRLPPAVDDARCTECQLIDSCLPEVVAHPGRVARHCAELLRCGS